MLSSSHHLSSYKAFSLFSHWTVSFIREGCVFGSLWITNIQEKKHLGSWRIFVCVHDQLLSHVRLFCNPMDCSPPGSSVHGISQARILEWGVISFSGGPALPKDQTRVSCISCLAGIFFTTEPPGKPWQIFAGWTDVGTRQVQKNNHLGVGWSRTQVLVSDRG